ncbi:hypothetical protein IC229_28730 [Spirosoma sp. BT702]|uniref:Uncharacterized protein n=1 Tax=Spirosoma profusum TaxID=2771354 RepID=A0A926Y3Y8_9BACT|nr:hypothetical protein [Spirosoma profusum]MBD2704657.1 hypothetical protein [Spirosoma profusum]
MNSFLTTLKSRNSLLYYFGWFCLLGTIVCTILTLITHTEVLGINAFIKPGKFFVSIAIFTWTMGWFTGLLPQRNKVRIYSWVVINAMLIELLIITAQAALGKLSHFNISSFADARLFDVMGAAITILTIWTAYIGYLFFRHKPEQIDVAYLWGIRLGILLFVIFAFEGFVMAAKLRHTIGAPDGGPGLPVMNWSTRYGDLRVAHFFGMHALQLLPLFAYYVARRSSHVILLAAFYFLFITFLLMQALAGKPLLASLTN